MFKVSLTICFIIAQWSLISANVYKLKDVHSLEVNSCFTDESFSNGGIVTLLKHELNLDFNSLHRQSIIKVEGEFELTVGGLGTVPYNKLYLNQYIDGDDLKIYRGAMIQNTDDADMHQKSSVSATATFYEESGNMELDYRVFASSTNADCCAGAALNVTQITIEV